MKKYSTSLIINEIKLKPQDTTLYLLGWQKFFKEGKSLQECGSCLMIRR